MKTILDSEEQLKQLIAYLAKSEAFKHCRGKLGKSDWLGTDVFKNTSSPTDTLCTFDWRHGQARVLFNHLAKLLREGHNVAANELMLALNHESFVITGEELPLDKRRSGVLLMFDVKRMLKLTRWLKLLDPRIIDRHLGVDKEKEQWKSHLVDRPGLKWLTDEVMGENPELKKCLVNFHRSPMIYFCRENFLPNSLLSIGINDFRQKWLVDGNRLPYHTKWLHLDEVRPGHNDDVLGNWGVACFIPDTTQAEVLGMIKRDRQDKVATWQFNYPVHLSNLSGYTASVGLFPEAELDRFKKMWPSYTSKSLQNGMGAVLLENNSLIPMSDPIFSWEDQRSQKDELDPYKVGIHLHFTEE